MPDSRLKGHQDDLNSVFLNLGRKGDAELRDPTAALLALNLRKVREGGGEGRRERTVKRVGAA